MNFNTLAYKYPIQVVYEYLMRTAWFQVMFPKSHYLSHIVCGLAKMLQDAPG